MMLLIIAHHLVVNSGVMEQMWSHPSSLNAIYLFIYGAWGKMAINCFVFITGYYMCTSHISVQKFARLFFQVLFYNVIIYCIFLCFGYEQLSWKGVLHLFPINDVQSNFVSCYLLFYLCIPFINILIHNLNQKKHFALIVICLFIYTVLNLFFTVSLNYVSWFVILYFISSFIRLYPVKMLEQPRKMMWASFVLLGLSVVSIIGCVYVSVILDKRVQYYFLSDSNALFAVLTSIALFSFFKNVKIRQSKFINAVASTTFGILMIHANSDAMRQWLWQDFLCIPQMIDSSFLIPYTILCVLSIFVVCSAIDFLFSRLIFCRIERVISKIDMTFVVNFKNNI